MWDYKSLHFAIMICTTLVNTQTDSFWPVILSAQPASWAKKWKTDTRIRSYATKDDIAVINHLSGHCFLCEKSFLRPLSFKAGIGIKMHHVHLRRFSNSTCKYTW